MHASLLRLATAQAPGRLAKAVFPPESKNLTLSHFILRAQAISLYRAYMRQLKPLSDPGTRTEMRNWIRSEFTRTRWESDPEKIRVLISEGHSQLKRVSALVHLGRA